MFLGNGDDKHCSCAFTLSCPTSHLVNFSLSIITAGKRSLGQGNMFTSVCHSVHRGGWGVRAPWHPPLTCTPLRRMVNDRAVRILLECILVYTAITSVCRTVRTVVMVRLTPAVRSVIYPGVRRDGGQCLVSYI